MMLIVKKHGRWATIFFSVMLVLMNIWMMFNVSLMFLFAIWELGLAANGIVIPQSPPELEWLISTMGLMYMTAASFVSIAVADKLGVRNV